MLNRRLLRIKVMQSLYSYHQAVGADLLLAQDRIAAAFEPDLTAKEAPDRRQLEGQRKMGEAQLREWYRTGTMPEKTDDKAVDKAVTDAINSFQNQVKKDGEFYGGQLLVGAESIHDQYLHLLNLPAALLGVIEEEQSREERRRLGPREDAAGYHPPAPEQGHCQAHGQRAAAGPHHPAQAGLGRRGGSWKPCAKPGKEMKADETVRAYLAGKDTGLARDGLRHGPGNPAAHLQGLRFQGRSPAAPARIRRLELGGKPAHRAQPGAEDAENAALRRRPNSRS